MAAFFSKRLLVHLRPAGSFPYRAMGISFAPGGFGLQLAIINGEGAVVAFWWVNHKQSWKAETSRGALWSPLTKSDGTHYRAYANMALARAGDIVFSFANGKIGHIGVVDAEATYAPKPDYATDAPWANEGWMLPVTFTILSPQINPRSHLDLIERYRPDSHSPIRANGHGTMNYLSAISDDFGNALLRLASLDLNRLTDFSTENVVLDDLRNIDEDSVATATLRLQLSNARIGQGAFRKRVLAMEPACRITGIKTASLLIASHIKPWRESTDAERLDGANGLMLAPHVDLLFDRHLISFTDDGDLIISKKLDTAVLERWHIANSAISSPFHPRQKVYLAAHRAHFGLGVKDFTHKVDSVSTGATRPAPYNAVVMAFRT